MLHRLDGLDDRLPRAPESGQHRIAVNIAKLPSVPRRILKDIPRPPNTSLAATIEAKTSDGLSSHERISTLASRLFVWGLAPAILDGQRKGRQLRRLSPHGDARWNSAKQQGAPDPPGRGSFLHWAYPFVWRRTLGAASNMKDIPRPPNSASLLHFAICVVADAFRYGLRFDLTPAFSTRRRWVS